LQNLVWLRAFGDTIFAVGIVGIALFVIGLKTGRSLQNK
jgi:nitric oxide reductase subunit B